MVSKKLDQHITNSYSRWSDYAKYHAKLAGIPDESGDILNEVLLSLMQKDPGQLSSLMSKKKGAYTELDFFVLAMIKLNAHSKTSPYRHKTRNVPMDNNITPEDLDITNVEADHSDHEGHMLLKCRKAREILDSLDIPDRDKEMFSWKFFADNSLRSWPGEESYPTVCTTYNRVKRQITSKIKNPHNQRKRWTEKEISYLKSEYPHMETIKIAGHMDRNYNSVECMARRLKLKKTPLARKKILRKNARNPLW